MTIVTIHLRLAGSTFTSIDSNELHENGHKRSTLGIGFSNGEGFCIIVPQWLSLLQKHGPIEGGGSIGPAGQDA